MEKQFTYTPTPWDMTGDSKAIVSFYDNHLHEIAKMIGQTEYGWSKKANAAFIVRACNSYDALAYGLAGLLSWIENHCDIEDEHLLPHVQKARIALKLANGE